MIPMDQSGMSLKDYFAAAAMQGMLANSTGNRQAREAFWARFAYDQAEAMLAEREKRVNKEQHKESTDGCDECNAELAEEIRRDNEAQLEEDKQAESTERMASVQPLLSPN